MKSTTLAIVPALLSLKVCSCSRLAQRRRLDPS
jgi:hypothetical protein